MLKERLRNTWYCSAFETRGSRIPTRGFLRVPFGDYSDVYVTSPYGSIPWAKASRFNDDEMKDLMVDVVNRTYRFKRILFDENTGPALLFQLAEHDPLPRWNQPTLPDNEELKARSKV